jgi:acetolactate synthase I/II/III large subunit
VVIGLPEDMLTEATVVTDAAAVAAIETHPSLTQMIELQKRLWAAKSPVAILGGSRWDEQAVARFVSFAERFELPTAVSFRRQMLFPAGHPCFAGDLGIGPNPKLLKRIKDADLVLLVGGRLSEMPSQGYSLFGIPEPGRQLIHVHPDSGELGRVYHPALAINASPTAFCAALQTVHPPQTIGWGGAAAEAHAAFDAWATTPAPIPGAFHPGEAVLWLHDRLPADAIICNGAGNYATWVHRFHRFRKRRRPPVRWATACRRQSA